MDPCYVNFNGKHKAGDVAEFFDKCIKAGAIPHEGVVGYENDDFDKYFHHYDWVYFGVDRNNNTLFSNYVYFFGYGSAKINVEEIDDFINGCRR